MLAPYLVFGIRSASTGRERKEFITVAISGTRDRPDSFGTKRQAFPFLSSYLALITH